MRFQREQDSTTKWSMGHSCYTVARILAVFSLYPENLSEAKLNCKAFSCLSEKFQERNTPRPWYGSHLLLLVRSTVREQKYVKTMQFDEEMSLRIFIVAENMGTEKVAVMVKEMRE